MTTNMNYENVFQLLKEEVITWDPYCLIDGGAPQSEFDTEVSSLATYIPKIENEQDLAHAVSKVFGKAFSASHFTPEKCKDFAKTLYERLKDSGLI